MRNRRTPTRPLFDIHRPIGNAWRWQVTYHVASSGYPISGHVTAIRNESTGDLVGTAWCDITVGEDLSEVLECLAVEAMLAACEPQLDGSPTTRRVKFSSTL